MTDDESINDNVKYCVNFSGSFSALRQDSTHVQVKAAASPNLKRIKSIQQYKLSIFSELWHYFRHYQWVNWKQESLLLKRNND